MANNVDILCGLLVNLCRIVVILCAPLVILCGLVCLNETVLSTGVRIGMANNVVSSRVHFLCTKNTLFIFRTLKMCDFMKQLPPHYFIIAPAQFSKILGHCGCTIHHASESVAFLRSDREKDKFLPIQLELV